MDHAFQIPRRTLCIRNMPYAQRVRTKLYPIQIAILPLIGCTLPSAQICPSVWQLRTRNCESTFLIGRMAKSRLYLETTNTELPNIAVGCTTHCAAMIKFLARYCIATEN
jgi:hypothetical protein